MAGWRRVVELAMTCEEIERLTALSRSRTEPASRVSRAQMRESFVLCGGATSWGSPSNGSALRGAGAGLWAARGDRGSATARQSTSHHAGGTILVAKPAAKRSCVSAGLRTNYTRSKSKGKVARYAIQGRYCLKR